MQFRQQKSVMLISIVALVIVVFAAIYLGNGSQSGDDSRRQAAASSYDLLELQKYKTPYVGNNWKVAELAGHLPLPDDRFVQRYISLETTAEPYGLTVFYEPVSEPTLSGEWPLKGDGARQSTLTRNALVLFSMVDNLENVTYAFRNTPSQGELESAKYDGRFSFQRGLFEAEYGDLKALGSDMERLQAALEE